MSPTRSPDDAGKTTARTPKCKTRKVKLPKQTPSIAAREANDPNVEVHGAKRLRRNRLKSHKNGWEMPLLTEDTFFINRRISHYGAMLKLTLEADDRKNLIRLLIDARWKLAMTKEIIANPDALPC